MKQLQLTILFLGLTMLSFAQDKHFSQFYAAPHLLNPAIAGLFEGRYRGMINYRSQWANLSDEPFTTTGAAVDGNFKLSKRSQYPDKLGVGVMIFSDKVGEQSYSTDQISFSGALHKALDYAGKKMLTAGYQVSIVQKGINYNQITFQDQFNGLNGYTLSTQEKLPINNITFADMAIGIFYSMEMNSKLSLHVGGSLSHVNSPDASFYENPDIAPDNIPLKSTIQGGARYSISKKYDFEPRIIILRQGVHTEIDAGANLRIGLDDYASQNLYLGLYLRPVGDISGELTLDAIIPMLAYRYENVQVGLSYDINMSTLSSVTAGHGGFELSASFIGSYENDNIICPQF
jgi:type IX secretion system PorP/SprF family membrane protein